MININKNIETKYTRSIFEGLEKQMNVQGKDESQYFT